MASANAGEPWVQLPLEGIYPRTNMDNVRGTTENEQFIGGVLSSRQEPMKWLPVGGTHEVRFGTMEGFIRAPQWKRSARHEQAWYGGPNGI